MITLTRFLNEQKWYDDHGGCLSAYVERYGDPDLPFCYGSGGTAIHAADKAALNKAAREAGIK